MDIFISFRIKEERYVDFFKNKIYTLLVPYLVFRILEIVIDVGYSLLLGDQMIRSDIINSVVGIFAQARNTSFESGLWFLPCLFLMQNIMYFIIIIKSCIKKYILILGILCIGILYQVYINEPLPWYIDIVFTSFIFILLGYIIGKYRQIFSSRGGIKYIWIIGLAIVHVLAMHENYNISGHSTNLYWNCYGNVILFYIAAISGSLVWILIFNQFYRNEKILAFIGKNSLLFYVLHQNIIMPICGFGLKKIINYQELNYLQSLGYFCIETILICLVCVPFVHFINKYLGFCIGKKKLSGKKGNSFLK